jgi:Dolichyl-phosphate-mannose-protein mannosyltransferase
MADEKSIADPPSAPKSGFRQRFGSSGFALILFLLAVTGTCLHHVIDGPKPWGKEVTKRLADGKELRAKEYGIIGVWWGCAISSALGGLLLLSAPLWMPGGRNSPRKPGLPPSPSGPAFHLILMMILTGAVVIRGPELSHSLWNDEEYALRRYIHGGQIVQPNGALAFEKVTWDETLFHNFNANNHLLQSAAARLTLDAWQFLRGKSPEAFTELVVRLPSFIAGIFTIVALALAGVEMRKPSIGLGAAALLTLHPWHVRYTVEARGYSLMLLFILVAVLALLHALRRDKISSWLLFALAQAAFLLSFAGSLYVAVALNLLALWEILRRREIRRLRTWIGFNLISAIPVLVWMLPSVPQLVAFLDREKVLNTPISVEWARDIGSHLAAGILYNNPLPDLHLGTSWIAQQSAPAWIPLLGYILPILALSGFFMALISPPASRLFVCIPLFGGLFAIAHNFATGQSMLSWYLLYLLLPLCLAIPLACHALLPWAERTAPGVIMAIVAVFGLTTKDARSRFVEHDRQPIREAVARYRESYPETLAITFGVSDRQLNSYDPRAIVVENPEQLAALIRLARTDKRPLMAVICGGATTEQRLPDLYRRVATSGDFVSFAQVPGLEAMFSYQIWRLNP